jgi:hypothetical protein
MSKWQFKIAIYIHRISGYLLGIRGMISHSEVLLAFKELSRDWLDLP